MTQNTSITQYIGTPINGMVITWRHDAASEGTTSNVVDSGDAMYFDVTWNFHSCALTTAWATRTTHSAYPTASDPGYPNELETADGILSASGSPHIVSSFILFLNPSLTTSDNTSVDDITYDGIYMPI